jgi:hypothetical protein
MRIDKDTHVRCSKLTRFHDGRGGPATDRIDMRRMTKLVLHLFRVNTINALRRAFAQSSIRLDMDLSVVQSVNIVAYPIASTYIDRHGFRSMRPYTVIRIPKTPEPVRNSLTPVLLLLAAQILISFTSHSLNTAGKYIYIKTEPGVSTGSNPRGGKLQIQRNARNLSLARNQSH